MVIEYGGAYGENRMGPDWGILSCHTRIFSLFSVVSGKMTEVFDSRWKIGY